MELCKNWERVLSFWFVPFRSVSGIRFQPRSVQRSEKHRVCPQHLGRRGEASVSCIRSSAVWVKLSTPYDSSVRVKVGKLAAACCRFLSTLAELASSCSRRLSDAKLAIISDVVLGVADGQGGGPRAIDAQALARVYEPDAEGRCKRSLVAQQVAEGKAVLHAQRRRA